MSEFWPPKQLSSLTELQGFDAMVNFLEAYWKLCGRSSDDIAGLLSSLSRGREPHPGTPPIDEALWDDWRLAVADALSQAS